MGNDRGIILFSGQLLYNQLLISLAQAPHPYLFLVIMGAQVRTPAKESFHMPEAVPTRTCPSPKGLKNIGNTCYMNASLQCLLQTPGLSQLLLSSVDGSASRAQEKLLRAYRGLVLKHGDQGSQMTVELKQLKKAIKEQHRQYGGFRQMDPTEFFLHVIGCFEEMSEELKVKLKELFGVETEISQKCENCGKLETFPSYMFSLSLPLQPAEVEISYRNGETSASFSLTCSEKATAADLSRLIQTRHSLSAPTLVLQTPISIDHIVVPHEPLRRMALQRKQLNYYENCEECYLLEVKVYHKVVMASQFVRLLSRRLQREVGSEAVMAAIRSLVLMHFPGVAGKIAIQRNGKTAFQAGLSEASTSFSDLQRLLDAFSDSILHVKVNLSNFLSFPRQLPLPSLQRIAKSISLENCLTQFLAVDHMGEDNMLKCEQCGVLTMRSRWSRLSQISQYLVICLQRYCELDGSKDTRIVHFSHELDLQTCSKPESSQRYSLYAVIRHHGTFTKGHYTSCVKGSNGWHLCNDSSIELIPPSSLQPTLEQDAYVLFYQSLN